LICYYKEWGQQFGGGASAEAPKAAEAILNSLVEIYDLLNTQLVLISIRTHAKAQNPAGWKLSAKDKTRLELLERERKSFSEKYGPESSDIPLHIFRTLAKFERSADTAQFSAAAKAEGQARAGANGGGGGAKGSAGGGGAARAKDVKVQAHQRAGPSPGPGKRG
jgi:hypothetical protein